MFVQAEAKLAVQAGWERGGEPERRSVRIYSAGGGRAGVWQGDRAANAFYYSCLSPESLEY